MLCWPWPNICNYRVVRNRRGFCRGQCCVLRMHMTYICPWGDTIDSGDRDWLLGLLVIKVLFIFLLRPLKILLERTDFSRAIKLFLLKFTIIYLFDTCNNRLALLNWRENSIWAYSSNIGIIRNFRFHQWGIWRRTYWKFIIFDFDSETTYFVKAFWL